MTATSTEIHTDDRAEILFALATANAEARRMTARDHLSQPSEAWAKKHAWVNTLLEMLDDLEDAE